VDRDTRSGRQNEKDEDTALEPLSPFKFSIVILSVCFASFFASYVYSPSNIPYHNQLPPQNKTNLTIKRTPLALQQSFLFSPMNLTRSTMSVGMGLHSEYISITLSSFMTLSNISKYVSILYCDLELWEIIFLLLNEIRFHIIHDNICYWLDSLCNGAVVNRIYNRQSNCWSW
jgi:hypothetical protein